MPRFPPYFTHEPMGHSRPKEPHACPNCGRDLGEGYSCPECADRHNLFLLSVPRSQVQTRFPSVAQLYATMSRDGALHAHWRTAFGVQLFGVSGHVTALVVEPNQFLVRDMYGELKVGCENKGPFLDLDLTDDE